MEFIPYKANECFEHLYYQIPMELFFNKNYKDKLNSDSKILYGFLLNRLTLSIKNNWVDISYDFDDSDDTYITAYHLSDGVMWEEEFEFIRIVRNTDPAFP